MKVDDESRLETGTLRDFEPPEPAQKKRSQWWIVVLAVLVAVGLVIFGIIPRIQADKDLKKETARMAIPTVSVVQPKRSAPAQELILPANVQAFSDAPIYARTNGYLKRWYVDMGARVKAGQLLAEIDTPEVNQQLRQARADLSTAEANLNLSRITAERYAGLLKTNSVSKQEADNAEGDYRAKQAVVQSAQANVKRLEELQSFEKIYAPFSGVITARNTDVGALIDSGASAGTRSELVHIAQPDHLRVYVNVPEAYSQVAKPGMTADLTLAEFPDRRFQGKLVRTASAIDPSSRTLLVEISVNNPTGQLFTGAYAEVHMKLPVAASSFTLPVNTLLFRSEGLRLAVVGERNKIEGRANQIWHEFGREGGIKAVFDGNAAGVIKT